jgi:ABC-type uncharacterized transport system fused permease/ATPase subunit
VPSLHCAEAPAGALGVRPASARQPTLAILDEAINALDASAEIAVLSVLKRRLSRTILVVVSHRPALAVLANRHVPLGEPAQA